MTSAPPLRPSTQIVSPDQINMGTLQREHHTNGSVSTEHLRLSAGPEQSFTAFSTTNTTDFQLVTTLPITIWATYSQLCVMLHTQVKHSSTALVAQYQLDMDLSNLSFGGSTALTFSRLQDIGVAYPTVWEPLEGVHTMDLAENSILPGPYNVQMWVKNLEAGTLSIGGTLASTRYISAFAYGREIV